MTRFVNTCKVVKLIAKAIHIFLANDDNTHWATINGKFHCHVGTTLKHHTIKGERRESSRE